MRLDSLFNSMVIFIVGIVIWLITGFVMQGLEPTILANAISSPQWFGWYQMYKTVYNYTPVLVLLASVLYLFLHRTSSNEQYQIK